MSDAQPTIPITSSAIKSKSAIKATTAKPKRVANDGTEKAKKPRRKKDELSSDIASLEHDFNKMEITVTPDTTATTTEEHPSQGRRCRKEKPASVNDLEKRIKSMKKRAATSSVSIDRLYTLNQTDNQQTNEELAFDRDVDADFDKMYEYKDYIVNYDRLKRLPTFDIAFKTVIVDEDGTTTGKSRGRTKKERIMAAASATSGDTNGDDDDGAPITAKASLDGDGDNDNDWKQDLRTMVVRNRIIRIDDDKGLVYNSEYELVGSVEEFEVMDDDEPETAETDAVEE